MATIGYVLAGLCLLGALRSGHHWLTHGLAHPDGRDIIWWSVFVTSRVGLWLSGAAVFVIAAASASNGSTLSQELAPYRWFVMIPIVLGAMQVLAAFFLARGAGDQPTAEND